jgi:hypothetical protein
MAEGWTVSFVGDRELVEAIAASRGPALEVGEPMELDSEVDALDSPIGADEVRQALELVTVFAGSASALITLAHQVLGLVKRFQKPVEVSSADGRRLMTVTQQTDEDELLAAIAPDR